MKNKILKAIGIGGVSAMIAATSIMPAFAKDATKYTPVNGQTITMDKILVMDAEANVPNKTFAFTIEPGTAIAAGDGTLEVLAGPAGATIGGTDGGAKFTEGQTTYSSVQKRTGNNLSGTTEGASIDDHVTLESGEKYAKSPVEINMSAVTFDEPGVYRYKIHEVALDPTNTNDFGLTNDQIADRYLDVYVEHNASDALEITGYVLHNSDGAVLATGALGDGDRKDGGYTNEYETEDLTISKDVTGNQASHDKFFKFVLEIEAGNPGTVYDVDLEDAIANTGAANSATLAAYKNQANPTSITVGADGTASATFYLQHGDSVKVQGLAKGTKYTITETPEDYTPAYALTEGSAAAVNGTTAVASDADGITGDTTVAFTNTRRGTIPTGVLVSIAPYLLIGGAAIGGVIVSKKRKKNA